MRSSVVSEGSVSAVHHVDERGLRQIGRNRQMIDRPAARQPHLIDLFQHIHGSPSSLRFFYYSIHMDKKYCPYGLTL